MSEDLVFTEPAGTIAVPAATLTRIVVGAAELVDGARVRRPRRGVEVEVDDAGAAVSLHLVARYGAMLPDLAEAVQTEVARARADVWCRRPQGRRRRRGARRPVTLSRRAARRTAFFLLYQWDVTGQPLASLYEGEVDEFARQTAEAVAARVEELDGRITAAAEGWTADRLGAVERNILRLAVHELDSGGVPIEVVIDEAVTLAKRYATEEAGRLVNGILGRIVREKEVA